MRVCVCGGGSVCVCGVVCGVWVSGWVGVGECVCVCGGGVSECVCVWGGTGMTH